METIDIVSTVMAILGYVMLLASLAVGLWHDFYNEDSRILSKAIDWTSIMIVTGTLLLTLGIGGCLYSGFR